MELASNSRLEHASIDESNKPLCPLLHKSAKVSQHPHRQNNSSGTCLNGPRLRVDQGLRWDKTLSK